MDRITMPFDSNVNSDEDEDILSDSLLTSLTDAAISNLSQLAALQERCESQHHQQDQSPSSPPQPQQQPAPFRPHSSSSIHRATPAGGGGGGGGGGAGAGGAGAQVPGHQQQPPPQQQQPQAHLSASQTSRLITSALTSPDFFHNLHQQQQQTRSQHHAANISNIPYHHHQRTPAAAVHPFHPTTSPITPSPTSQIASPAAAAAAAQLAAVAAAAAAAQRRSTSTTPSSSLISPITSPNYLRRQIMASSDRTLPLMSPSPTSGLSSSGISSGASSSLGHILGTHQQQQHHHHAHPAQQHHPSHQQQPRSASALAGPITSPLSASTSTSLSACGSSTAVSPLINSKNSSQARLNNMQIRHKFGYLGSGRAQFNSPHGFCLGVNQEIVVADTNNHRICIFDKSGTYLTQFGSPGKEEGQLWNPRKVAILHRPTTSANLSSVPASVPLPPHLQRHHNQSIISAQQQTGQFTSNNNNNDNDNNNNSTSNNNNNNNSGNKSSIFNGNEPLYVVCDRGAERSRMQLFSKDGVFIKKIGIHYIDIVAGLAITQSGLIIVVDSVSPTVYIINGETGTLNGWFDCSGHMKEPSDIIVKSDIPGNEYFICDFKGHCVVVFSEQGEYLRRIGHDGLTSYPNGIDISDDGDILVGDSHGNRFHVVVFDRNGNFVSQFECPHVKVSRCCGLKITREGYIVTLAKNNHHVLVLDTIHI